MDWFPQNNNYLPSFSPVDLQRIQFWKETAIIEDRSGPPWSENLKCIGCFQEKFGKGYLLRILHYQDRDRGIYEAYGRCFGFPPNQSSSLEAVICDSCMELYQFWHRVCQRITTTSLSQTFKTGINSLCPHHLKEVLNCQSCTSWQCLQ